MFGWREVFWALTPVVAINLVWHAIALPLLPTGQTQDFRAMFGLLKRPHFLRGLHRGSAPEVLQPDGPN